LCQVQNDKLKSSNFQLVNTNRSALINASQIVTRLNIIYLPVVCNIIGSKRKIIIIGLKLVRLLLYYYVHENKLIDVKQTT